MPRNVRSLTTWPKPSALAATSCSSTRVLVGGSVLVKAGSASSKTQAFHKIAPSIREEEKARRFAFYQSKDKNVQPL